MSTFPCPSCGMPNEGGAATCSHCWTSLLPGASQTPEPGLTPPAPANVNLPPSPEDSAPGYASGRTQQQAPQQPPATPPVGPGTGQVQGQSQGTPIPPPPPLQSPGAYVPLQSRFPAQQMPVAKSRKATRIGPAIGVVVVIALFRSGIFFNSASTPPVPLTLPSTVGGQPKILVGQPADDVAKLVTQMTDDGIVGGDGAAYGTGDKAAYWVFVAPGEADDAPTLYSGMTDGLQSPSEPSVTVGSQEAKEVSGIPLLCSDILNNGDPRGAFCVWSHVNQGIVISFNPGIDKVATTSAEVAAEI